MTRIMKQQNLPKKNIYQMGLRKLRNMLMKIVTLIAERRKTQLGIKNVNPIHQRKEKFKQETLRMNLKNVQIVRRSLQTYPDT